jgi:hypothetical protein
VLLWARLVTILQIFGLNCDRDFFAVGHFDDWQAVELDLGHHALHFTSNIKEAAGGITAGSSQQLPLRCCLRLPD